MKLILNSRMVQCRYLMALDYVVIGYSFFSDDVTNCALLGLLGMSCLEAKSAVAVKVSNDY